MGRISPRGHAALRQDADSGYGLAMLRLTLLAALAFLALSACGPLTKPGASLPAGVTCARILISATDFTSTLGTAAAGDCVLLPAGTYRGNFVVPENVSVVAGDGATVTLRGSEANQPVLTVRGGAKTVIRGIRIDVSSGGGIVVEPGPVNMEGVSVTGTSQAGLTASCNQADCDQRQSTVNDSEFSNNTTGIVLSGAKLKLTGGRVGDNQGPALTDGSGIVVANGASLEVVDTMVENNAGVGVLIDGAATRVLMTRPTVRGNKGRGVWAQGLVGTGTLQVLGGAFSQNNLVAVGSIQSEGLLLKDATVATTQKVPVVIDLGHTEYIGDGVGLFKGTKNSSMENLTLTDNARAQALIDSVGDGIHGTTLTASGGTWRLVVQNTTVAVDVPSALSDSPPTPLVLDDTSIPVHK
jgi:hypothetical protein